MPWNAEQYHRFQAERSAPFHDLLRLVDIRPHLMVVDLGCGTGELTRLLAEVLPASEVIGLDSSMEMLEKAAPHSTPNLRFEHGDQSRLAGKWDLIFSNAAIQWSDNHQQLLPDLISRLNPAGQLCIQIPANHNHISHLLIRETAREQPFNEILGGFERLSPVLSIDQYVKILFEQSTENIVVFEKVYPHVLEDSDAVVEWLSGTALIPYFERLGGHRPEFLDVLRKKMSEAMPESPLLYPFRRILFSAKKPGGHKDGARLVK
jgi:trans-aconitate 2-methyltransferase